jgi:hypothetical protein
MFSKPYDRRLCQQGSLGNINSNSDVQGHCRNNMTWGHGCNNVIKNELDLYCCNNATDMDWPKTRFSLRYIVKERLIVMQKARRNLTGNDFFRVLARYVLFSFLCPFRVFIFFFPLCISRAGAKKWRFLKTAVKINGWAEPNEMHVI